MIRCKKGEFMGNNYLGQKAKYKLRDVEGNVISLIDTEIIGIDLDSYFPIQYTLDSNVIDRVRALGVNDYEIMEFVALYKAIKRGININLSKMEILPTFILLEKSIKSMVCEFSDLEKYASYIEKKNVNPLVLVKSKNSYAKPICEIKLGKNVIFYGNKNTKVEWADIKNDLEVGE